MKKLIKLIRTAVLLGLINLIFVFNPIYAQETQAQKFIFRFEPNLPQVYTYYLNYDLETKFKATNDQINLKMKMGMGCELKLTQKEKLEGGINRIYLEPSNLKGVWEVDGSTGHLTAKLDGEDLVVVQNGKTIIDTKNKIGTQKEAQEIKNEIIGFYLKGDLDLDRLGNVQKISGDPVFIHFWSETTEWMVGFLGLVFPDHPINIDDNWQIPLKVTKMNQIFLDDPGITVPNKFTRKADKTINNKKLAIFELSGLFDLQNLTGSFEQEDGKMLIDLPLFKRKVTGIIAFDQEKSQITSGEINLLAVVKMLSKTEGDQVKGDYNLKATLTIKNLGVN